MTGMNTRLLIAGVLVGSLVCTPVLIQSQENETAVDAEFAKLLEEVAAQPFEAEAPEIKEPEKPVTPPPPPTPAAQIPPVQSVIPPQPVAPAVPPQPVTLPSVPALSERPVEAPVVPIEPIQPVPTPPELPATPAVPEVIETKEEIIAVPEPEEPKIIIPEDAQTPTMEDIAKIDTSELAEPQGNWLFKRIWWERAEEKFEKIRGTLTQALEIRMTFFSKRSDIDRDLLDPFYVRYGANEVSLQTAINQLINLYTTERERQGKLPEADLDRLEQLEGDKKLLEDVKKNLSSIQSLDHAIDDALNTLITTTNRMRQLEQEAWSKFKRVSRTLDDKKARSLYFEIDGLWQNIKTLYEYIRTDFTQGFDRVAKQLRAKIQEVDDVIKKIQEHGIDLKKQIELLVTGGTLEGISVCPMAPKAPEQPIEEMEEEEPGFITRYVVNPINYIGSTVMSVITWPYRALFGSEESVEETPVEPVLKESTEQKEKKLETGSEE